MSLDWLGFQTRKGSKTQPSEHHHSPFSALWWELLTKSLLPPCFLCSEGLYLSELWSIMNLFSCKRPLWAMRNTTNIDMLALMISLTQTRITRGGRFRGEKDQVKLTYDHTCGAWSCQLKQERPVWCGQHRFLGTWSWPLWKSQHKAVKLAKKQHPPWFLLQVPARVPPLLSPDAGMRSRTSFP